MSEQDTRTCDTCGGPIQTTAKFIHEPSCPHDPKLLPMTPADRPEPALVEELAKEMARNEFSWAFSDGGWMDMTEHARSRYRGYARIAVAHITTLTAKLAESGRERDALKADWQAWLDTPGDVVRTLRRKLAQAEQRVAELEEEILKHKDDRSYWAERCHAVILEKRHAEQENAALWERVAQLDALKVTWEAPDTAAECPHVRDTGQGAPTRDLDPPAKSSVCSSGHTWVTAVSEQQPEPGTPCHCGVVSWPAPREGGEG